MYIIVEISEIMSIISFSCCCCGFLHLLDSVPQVDFHFCFPTFQNTKKIINFFFRWFPIQFSQFWNTKKIKLFSSQRLLFVVVTLFGNWTKKLQQVKNSCSSNPQDCLSKYWSDLHFPYISYIFNIWISRGKQHCSRGVFLWKDPGLRTSMIFLPSSQVQHVLFMVSGVFHYFNSILNPILYTILSTRFRRGFSDMSGKCWIYQVRFWWNQALSQNFAEVRKSCVPTFRGGGDQPWSGAGVDPCDWNDWIRILKLC